MKNKIFIIVLICFSLNAVAQKKPKIKGDKNVVTTTYEIANSFNAIEVDSRLEISFSQADQNNYTLIADSNLHDVINFTVSDSVLKIYTYFKIKRSKSLDISLNIKNLDQITIKDRSKVEGKGIIETDTMNVNAYDSSKFYLDVRADEVTVSLEDNSKGDLKSTATNTTLTVTDRANLNAIVLTDKTTANLLESAQLKLEGDSKTVDFNLQDSSRLDAKDMRTESVDIYTANKANANVYASKNLAFYAQDDSSIYIYGNSKIEVKGFMDQSKIFKK